MRMAPNRSILAGGMETGVILLYVSAEGDFLVDPVIVENSTTLPRILRFLEIPRLWQSILARIKSTFTNWMRNRVYYRFITAPGQKEL
jgi:hypothetical protein